MRGQPQLVTLTILGFISAFLGLPLLTFLPVIAKDVFQQDVGLYTQFMALPAPAPCSARWASPGWAGTGTWG